MVFEFNGAGKAQRGKQLATDLKVKGKRFKVKGAGSQSDASSELKDQLATDDKELKAESSKLKGKTLATDTHRRPQTA